MIPQTREERIWLGALGASGAAVMVASLWAAYLLQTWMWSL